MKIYFLIQLSSLLVQGQGPATGYLKHSMDTFDQFGWKQKTLLNQLRKSIVAANGGFNLNTPSQDLPIRVVENGIVNLLREKKQFSVGQGFKEIFDKYVVTPCDPVVRQMSPVKRVYDRMLREQVENSEDFDTASDTLTMEWFINARICINIFENLEKVKQHVANKLV